MNRNTETRFAQIEMSNIQRSTFDLSQNIKTTFNAGLLIPFFVELDVMPADTFKVNTSIVVRLNTPLNPTMDNCYLDTYYFYVPYRILWMHWKEFMGENKTTAWVQPTEYTIPMFTTPYANGATGMESKTIADYMGIPIGVPKLEFSQLPVRAYIKIFNEWFRDQNVTAPKTEFTDDIDKIADNENDTHGGKPLHINKYHDYFTSCLPEPQKGDPVIIPIGDTAPINGTVIQPITVADNQTTDQTVYMKNGNYLKSGTKQMSLFVNGTADLSEATAISINTIREAFSAQRILEMDARGGTRYTEIIKNVWGITSPDARQQRPEYLGGKRIPITIQQIPQTSSTDATSPQGNAGALSITCDSDATFTKSFTEHGCIIGIMAVRQDHSYQQGLHKSWSRKRKLDFYRKELAHLGEMAVLNKEIFAQGNDVKDEFNKIIDDMVFGYQERWAELKYKPNLITGSMRSTSPVSLDVWHYGDDYDSLPVLSETFMQEEDTFIGRTLAIPDEDQFRADILVNIKATRAMPVYCTPGLIDHF